MHSKRSTRIHKELKAAQSMSLSLKFDVRLSPVPITISLQFDRMPVLSYKSGSNTVVKCLPLNQVGIGKNQEEAKHALQEDLQELLIDALQGSRLWDQIALLLQGQADEVFWSKYKDLAQTAIAEKLPKPGKRCELELESRFPVPLGSLGLYRAPIQEPLAAQ